MTRDVPQLVSAWKVGGRVFDHRSNAYEAIAASLVREKYPRWITFWVGSTPPSLINATLGMAWPDGWTVERLDRRTQKFRRLFFVDGGFNKKKYSKFVNRLARFLMFVDKRRPIGLELDSHLEQQYQYCELQMLKFGRRSEEARLELERRGAKQREAAV